VIANLGLEALIAYSQPVLMFLYPLAIVLILLTLCGRAFQNDRTVLRWTIGLTAVAAVFDLIRALPAGTQAALHLTGVAQWAVRWVPLAQYGFGWVVPALAGLAAGLILR